MSAKNFIGRGYVRAGIAGVIVAAVVTSMALAGGASAQSLPRTAPALPRSASVPDSEGNTLGFAGYLATPTNGFASASTTFVVPTESSCSDTYDGVSQVVGIIANNTATQAGIYEYCDNSTPVYDYLAETPAGVVEEPATPGDTVVASMFETGKWTEAEVHDITNGQYWAGTYSSGGTDTAVDIGVDSSGPPIIPFSTTTMTMVQVNGDYLGFESPEQLRATAFETNRVLIASGPLSAHGTSFKVTFKQSN
jgi:hypothetical protein